MDADAPPRRTLVLASDRTRPGVGAEIAAGLRPRLDYRVMADALGGDVLGAEAGGPLAPWRGRLERALASDVGQAQVAWRRRGLYGAWLSTSEKVGLPLALRRMAAGGRPAPAHVLIAHNLTSARKRQLHALTGVLRRGFSSIICLSGTQEAFLRGEVGLPPGRVHRLNDNVDTHFFRPSSEDAAGDGGYLLAVGRENRDYPTLIAAARLLGLPLIIVASSLWAARGGALGEDALPAGVTVRDEFIPYPALRDLYAGARAVVVPLHEASYAAGINGVMEAMAMGRPVVVSRTAGLADYLADARTHRSCPPGDPAALAAALRALWDDGPARRRMARAARAQAEAELSMERYAAGVAEVVRRAMEEEGP